MAKRTDLKGKGKQIQKRMVVTMRHVATPDAEERLCSAMEILLRAAARDTSQSQDSPDADKEKPSARGTHEAAGDGEMNNGNHTDVPNQ